MSDRHFNCVIFRILNLTLAAIGFSLGVLVVLENREIARVLQATPLRDALLIFGPVIGLSVLSFSLAVRSSGMRSLKTEIIVNAIPVSLYLGIVLSNYFTIVTEMATCPWWRPR